MTDAEGEPWKASPKSKRACVHMSLHMWGTGLSGRLRRCGMYQQTKHRSKGAEHLKPGVSSASGRPRRLPLRHSLSAGVGRAEGSSSGEPDRVAGESAQGNERPLEERSFCQQSFCFDGCALSHSLTHAHTQGSRSFQPSLKLLFISHPHTLFVPRPRVASSVTASGSGSACRATQSHRRRARPRRD